MTSPSNQRQCTSVSCTLPQRKSSVSLTNVLTREAISQWQTERVGGVRDRVCVNDHTWLGGGGGCLGWGVKFDRACQNGEGSKEWRTMTAGMGGGGSSWGGTTGENSEHLFTTSLPERVPESDAWSALQVLSCGLCAVNGSFFFLSSSSLFLPFFNCSTVYYFPQSHTDSLANWKRYILFLSASGNMEARRLH